MNMKMITFALSSLLFAFSTSYAEEEGKADNKLPEVITEYIEKILPGFKTQETGHRDDDGSIIYEICDTYDDLEYTLEITEGGAIIELRRDDDGNDDEKMPVAVTQMLEKVLPGLELTRMDSEIVNGEIRFLIEGKHNKHEYELELKGDGTIIDIESDY